MMKPSLLAIVPNELQQFTDTEVSHDGLFGAHNPNFNQRN
jgi:hypothetical protein